MVELYYSELIWVQVVTDLDGNYIMQVGSTGEEGLEDGPFDIACFNRPQVCISVLPRYTYVFIIYFNIRPS